MNLQFKRSSFCGESYDCIEVAVVPTNFVKSSFCNAGDCIEVDSLSGGNVAIRDSKLYPNSPELFFSAKDWEALRTEVDAGGLGYDDLRGVIHSIGCIRLCQSPDGKVLVSDVHQPEPEQTLSFTPEEWEACCKGIKNNEF